MIFFAAARNFFPASCALTLEEKSFLMYRRNSVKSFNFQKRAHLIIHLLLVGLLASGSACSLTNLSGDRNISAARSENQSPKTAGAEQSGAANQAPADTVDVEGNYNLNNYRDGEGGYVNSLIVEKPAGGKV